MIRILAFDVFGTVTDWLTGIRRELEQLFPHIDAEAMTADWRRAYAPSLETVESGRRPWDRLDDLHRESLAHLMKTNYGALPTPTQLDHAVEAWHRAPAWPDAAPALEQIRRKLPVSTLSNADAAMLSHITRQNNLTWDFLGAQTSGGTTSPLHKLTKASPSSSRSGLNRCC